MNRVLVTGASGFIGRELCRALQSNGVFVRALLRSETKGPWDDFVIGDLTEHVSEICVDKIDTVIHLAGKAHALHENRQDQAEFFRINKDGTRKLLEVSRKAGVRSFVYFSSVKAMGESEDIMDETFTTRPSTPYGESKRAAESLVLGGGYVPHPVVIRPSLVYGNCTKGNLSKMICAVAAGNFPPLPEFNNRRSMIHVHDVAQAAILAVENEAAAGEVFIITDGTDYSTRQIYEWICQVLNRPIPAWSIPVIVLKLLGKVGDLIGCVRGWRFVFDSDALEKLSGNACYSSKKIEKMLGFKARYQLRETLPEISSYLQADQK